MIFQVCAKKSYIVKTYMKFRRYGFLDKVFAKNGFLTIERLSLGLPRGYKCKQRSQTVTEYIIKASMKNRFLAFLMSGLSKILPRYRVYRRMIFELTV